MDIHSTYLQFGGRRRTFSFAECCFQAAACTTKILGFETRYKRTSLWETERYICLVHNTHLFHRCSAAGKLRRVYKYRFLTVGQRAGGYCYGDGMAPRRLPDWVHIIRYVVLDARQSLPSILRVVFCGGGRKSLGKGSMGTSS